MPASSSSRPPSQPKARGRGIYHVPAVIELVADSADEAYALVFAAEAARSKARPDAAMKIRLGPKDKTVWHQKEPARGGDTRLHASPQGSAAQEAGQPHAQAAPQPADADAPGAE